MKKLVINNKNYNQRLDKYLLKYMNKATKSFIYKMLRKKRIKLNGKKAEGNEILNVDDEITMYLAEETIDSFREEKSINRSSGKIKVVYEDENLLICNKPAGVLSQPNSKDDNMLDRAESYLANKGEAVSNIAISNRLDMNTTGLIIITKNFITSQSINEQIKNKSIEKRYVTIVKGELDNKKDRITSYWMNGSEDNKVKIFSEQVDDSKRVELEYKVLDESKEYSLLEINLITGKKHQIRAQMAHIGHPIIGDTKYGDKKVNRDIREKYGLKYQLLHAFSLKFDNQEYKAEIPKIFSEIIGKTIDI